MRLLIKLVNGKIINPPVNVNPNTNMIFTAAIHEISQVAEKKIVMKHKYLNVFWGIGRCLS